MSDYQICSDNNNNLKFSCYLLTNDFLKDYSNLGFFRLLETNKRLFLPTNIHIRLLVTAVDVLHSWTIPSFGIKVDACPGRLNQANLFIKRFGVFF
jgi:cytochrome c oxidase subunit 2